MNTPDCKQSEFEKNFPIRIRDTLTCSGQRSKANDSDSFGSKVFASKVKHSAVACETDSGGPLVCRKDSNSPFYLEGIISYGYGEKFKNIGVRLTYSFKTQR